MGVRTHAGLKSGQQARCKEIAVRKLGEAEERSVFLVIFHAWQMYLLLSQEEKEEDVPDEAQEASETGRPCISSLVNRAVKKQRAKDEEKKLEADKAMKASDRKSVEEAQAKVAALEKSLKDSEDAKAKVTALEQNVKDLEEKNAEEKAKVEKLEAEAKKNKSCCCILQ